MSVRPEILYVYFAQPAGPNEIEEKNSVSCPKTGTIQKIDTLIDTLIVRLYA